MENETLYWDGLRKSLEKLTHPSPPSHPPTPQKMLRVTYFGDLPKLSVLSVGDSWTSKSAYILQKPGQSSNTDESLGSLYTKFTLYLWTSHYQFFEQNFGNINRKNLICSSSRDSFLKGERWRERGEFLVKRMGMLLAILRSAKSWILSVRWGHQPSNWLF